MNTTKSAIGYIQIFWALVVAIQFVASPLYGGDLNGTVWDAVSNLMAIGVLAALVVSILRLRESPDMGAKVMFIASLVLFLLFVRLWFSSQIFESDEKPPYEFRLLMWYGIDVLYVVVNLFVGRYLVRSAQLERRGS